MPMDDGELVNIIERKLERSLNDQGGGVSDVREDNFDRYYGKEYGTERKGYSSYVSRECLEVIEWAMPAVMKVLIQDNRQIVEFDPVGPEDEDAARQETMAVNYWLLRKNKGFLALFEFVKDALMNPVAYAKVWIDDRTKVTRRTYDNLLAGELEILAADRQNEILTVVEKTITVEGQEIPVFEVEIERTDSRKSVTFSTLAPEEVLIDRTLTSLDMDEADFICHRARRTMSELVEMGIDAGDLDGLTIDSEHEFDDERTNRLFYEEEHPTGADEDDEDTPTQGYWVHEIWGRFDCDEDNVAEQRHILMIGNEIFINEEIEYQPIVAVSAIPIPHKHTGISYVETVKDLQAISSDLIRQLLDNVYNQTVNKKYIYDGAILENNETLDQILDPESEFVITRMPPGQSVEFEQRANIIPEILQAIELLKDVPHMRSGVSPELSLDPDVLKQTTEGAFEQAMQWSNQRLELLVRLFAELGLKPIALKAHQLLRTEVDEAQTVKLRGAWVTVNPGEWEERTDMTVNAGLGHATDIQKLTNLRGVLDLQKEALGFGLASPKHIYTTLEKMVEAASLGSASQYFVDPESPEYQPPQPQEDPALLVAQAELMKAQTEQQVLPARVKADMLKAQTEQQTKVGVEQAKIQQAWAEIRLKEQELGIKREETQALITRDDDVSEADIALKEAQAAKARADARISATEASDLATELVTYSKKTGQEDRRKAANE